jgi:hypothetical protein
MITDPKMPFTKQLMPKVLAEDIAGVQPMMENVGKIFTFKNSSMFEPKQGALQHSFVEGWQCYYGTQWISVDLWLKIKIKGL